MGGDWEGGGNGGLSRRERRREAMKIERPKQGHKSREAHWGARCWEEPRKVTSGPLKEPQERRGDKRRGEERRGKET